MSLLNCTKTNKAENQPTVMKDIIIEVTSFKTKSEGVNSTTFQNRDANIQEDFTAKQPGFIKRISGINDAGEYVVIVYWKTMADAEASMKKFMSDKSVADYASMIDGPTMKMARYKISGEKKLIDLKKGTIAEVTSFKAKPDIGTTAFLKSDANVEKNYTSKQPGFIQRISAVNEKGDFLVLVYWQDIASAQASMKKFMNDKSVSSYVKMIDAPTMKMAHYKTL